MCVSCLCVCVDVGSNTCMKIVPRFEPFVSGSARFLFPTAFHIKIAYILYIIHIFSFFCYFSLFHWGTMLFGLLLLISVTCCFPAFFWRCDVLLVLWWHWTPTCVVTVGDAFVFVAFFIWLYISPDWSPSDAMLWRIWIIYTTKCNTLVVFLKCIHGVRDSNCFIKEAVLSIHSLHLHV